MNDKGIITVKVQVIFQEDLFSDPDKKNIVAIANVFPYEMLLLPEYLETTLEHMQDRIKDHIRNLPEEEFNQ